MVVVKPNLVRTDSVDDTQTINSVEQIYKNFIVPIDNRLRSIKDAPGLGTVITQSPRGYNTDEEKVASRSIVGGRVDSLRYNESRCHALYRNIGFPVAAPDGSFYNSGHDPNQRSGIKKREKVKTKLIYDNSNITKIISKREDDVKERRDLFAKRNEVATVYALLLRKPRPFLSAKTGQGPFVIDEQKTPINSRVLEINDLNIEAKDIPDIVTNVPHILKPFIVDPTIQEPVQPEMLRTVAVPFLASKKDLVTGFDEKGNKTYAIRPLIEQIIRNRLEVKKIDSNFINSAKYILTNSKSNATNSDVKTALLALSGQASLSSVTDDILKSIQDFTTLESTITITLIKAIKVAVNELNVSIRDLERIKLKINLQPIPDINGPEFPQGGKIKTSSGILPQSNIQKKKAILKLQQLVNERLNGKSDDRVGENAYISGVSVDLTKDLTSAINKLQKIENELGRQALNLLSIIEKVTGEISGIGIVDILGIYTALYTIDMRFLIGFLDEASLERLNNNFSELVNDEVTNQLKGNRPTIIDCLTEFEKIFFNILAFADSLVITSSQTPIKARKGSIK